MHWYTHAPTRIINPHIGRTKTSCFRAAASGRRRQHARRRSLAIRTGCRFGRRLRRCRRAIQHRDLQTRTIVCRPPLRDRGLAERGGCSETLLAPPHHGRRRTRGRHQRGATPRQRPSRSSPTHTKRAPVQKREKSHVPSHARATAAPARTLRSDGAATAQVPYRPRTLRCVCCVPLQKGAKRRIDPVGGGELGVGQLNRRRRKHSASNWCEWNRGHEAPVHVQQPRPHRHCWPLSDAKPVQVHCLRAEQHCCPRTSSAGSALAAMTLRSPSWQQPHIPL